MEEKYCEVCGSPINVEEHHIIFRSKAPYMINININLKYLCNICHRGDNGPHLDRQKDLEYKRQLQYKVSELFYKDYYSYEEVRDKLETTDKEVRKIIKVLIAHPEGYSRTDILVRLMGGRLYIK